MSHKLPSHNGRATCFESVEKLSVSETLSNSYVFDVFFLPIN